MERFAGAVAHYSGNSWAFIIAFMIVIVRALTGPLFDFSTTRQLVINTWTTIITFLMVFLIQKAQNKESVAVQIKLNELIAANRNASNRLIDVEDLSEDELNLIRDFYVKLAELAKKRWNIHHIYSIDAAHANHLKKDTLWSETLEIEENVLDRIMADK